MEVKRFVVMAFRKGSKNILHKLERLRITSEMKDEPNSKRDGAREFPYFRSRQRRRRR
jgi:hypothetical protein